ncbi:glycoside hydrolase family 3 protein [Egibacter rhizosphaerae]|uniref:Glycoside hydrolase family 3 protein n=1 Tax=Egibacter rhizosphaerae TaxID=1670831 RepID=A0A411YDH3_9ACTN|nr:glycoside hydrolase family 3 N-terminal domain-containing protein [Egibacter rhizosphaerae]QBI19212.1 glycoside hydrolase family 3 protein [Egibacter rhizosphaerae]
MTTPPSPSTPPSARLDLPELISQTLWLVVHGPDPDRPDARNEQELGVGTPRQAIRALRPGGIVAFAWSGNCAHPQQLAHLVAALQDTAGEEAGMPLAVAIDEEGGRVRRLPPPATQWPSARALARAAGPEEAQARWAAAGTELLACGITTNLAPVVDVDAVNNPVVGDRAFGTDATTVSAHATAAVEGLQQAGVAAVAKHFPGHGAVAGDSHEALPHSAAGRASVEDRHLAAFRQLFADARPAGVMTGHLRIAALDGAEPATTSPAITRDLLRRELGYDGLVLTDSLAMGALADREPGAVAVEALAAGADVLLTPPDPGTAHAAVLEAVEQQRLSADRVAEAADRVAAHRTRWRAEGDGRAADDPSHRSLALDLAHRAVVVNDPVGLLPIDRALVVGATVAGPARGLADALAARGVAARLCELGGREGIGDGPLPSGDTMNAMAGDDPLVVVSEPGHDLTALLAATGRDSSVHVRTAVGEPALPRPAEPATTVDVSLPGGDHALVAATAQRLARTRERY